MFHHRRLQYRLLVAIITSWALSWVLAVQPFVAVALGAEPLQEIVAEPGTLGINNETEDYDPWEPFNEKIFMLNCAADRYVLRPVAKAYNDLVLDGEKDAIHNMLDNVAMPKRFINSLLQGKFNGAGRELARFLINSTLGMGGMADVAKYQFHIQRSNEDGGKTLAYYGMGAGPYLVLPLLPPLTVRDGIGYILNMDPINFFVPLLAVFSKGTGDMINGRAATLQVDSGEDVTLDHYAAARNTYLTRRQQ
jgi:phospholipid-binding lipoprotein MlaA